MQVTDVPANYLFQVKHFFEDRWVWAKMSCHPKTQKPIIASNNYYLILVNVDEPYSFNLSEKTNIPEILLVDRTDRFQHHGTWVAPDSPVQNVVRDYSELPNQ